MKASSSLIFSSFFGVASLHAADLTVLNTSDSGPGSLRAIIQTANSNNEADSISFTEALRGETIVLTSDELALTSEITITGFSRELTISGNEERRIFVITNDAEVTISDLDLIDGVANRGGGINNAGTLSVDNCLFRNHSGSVGSGIENSGTITVTDSSFEDNFATDDGAGFNNCFPGTGLIDRCSFSGNTIPNNGAALSNFFELTVTNSTFFNNSAVNEDDDGTGSIPTRNGGAIFNNRTLTLANCTFFDNIAGNSGGAIYHRGESLSLINCTLSGNQSPRGAAISSRSGAQLIQTTITNNISSEGGGGLFFQDFGNFQVSNSIVANNSNPQILLSDNLSAQSFFLFPGGRNIFSDDSITTVPNFTNPFAFITNTDPLLGDLADNGGLVLTHALLPSSPAIDAGQNFAAVDTSFVPLTTDARGANRITAFSGAGEATVDLGAFEAIPLAEDSDGDGVPDADDAFPDDPNESADSDNDGIGDNSDPDPNTPNSPLPTVELIVNGSFEDTAIIPTTFVQLAASQVPGWNSNGNALEFWADGFLGFESIDGEQFAELNALNWQQTVTATPGSTLQWSFYHRGRRTTDTVNLSIGVPGAEVFIDSFSTSPDNWVRYEGSYQVPNDQSEISILFTPEITGRGGTAANLLDGVSLVEEIPAESESVMMVIEDFWTQSNGFKSISLSGFTDPIVIASPLSFNGRDAAHVRIDNVTPDGFEYTVEEWLFQPNRNHSANETVYFLIVERGVHLVDGVLWEAGSTLVSDQWSTVNLESTQDGTQNIFSQVVTFNEQDPVVTRHDDITAATFDLRLQEEKAGDQEHTNETVHYIAHSLPSNPVAGTISGVAFQSGQMGNVSNTESRIDFADVASPPALFAQVRTFNGADPVGIRTTSLSNTEGRIFLEEETSDGSGIFHVGETVDWLIFELE